MRDQAPLMDLLFSLVGLALISILSVLLGIVGVAIATAYRSAFPAMADFDLCVLATLTIVVAPVVLISVWQTIREGLKCN